MGNEHAFTIFEVLADVGLLVDHSLDFYVELFAGELLVDFVVGPGGVCIMDVDEVWFDVVGNRLVVHWFPELSLSRSPVEVILQCAEQIHQLSSGLIIINGHNKTRSFPQGEVPPTLAQDHPPIIQE